MNRLELIRRMCDCGVVPVFRTHLTHRVMDASKAIYDGGIPFIEYTTTMSGALGLIETAVKELPSDAVIGAGTVLDAPTARLAILAGAHYVVSPGLSPEVVEMCHRYGIATVPGVYTPSEVMQALGLGVDVLKLFPACNGPRYLAEVAAAFPQVRFMAAAGITLENVADYIAAGAQVVTQAAQGMDAEAFEAGDYGRISGAAARFMAAVQKAKAERQ